MATKKYLTEKKNVLITGGAGFIGSHLCDELIKTCQVICVDDFITSSIENINHLLQYPNFIFIKHDITKPLNLEEYNELDKFKVKFQGIQEIYHLACPTSPKNFDKFKIKTLQANSVGTMNILDLAVKYKAKLLFTSSAVVYGPRYQDSPHLQEDYQGWVNFTSPRSCYDEGKRFSESAVVTYRDMYNIDAKIVRVFRTYGPRMSLFDGHMLPDFVLQALNNKPLVIYGDENFTSTFCYVNDIINGLIRMMDSKEKGPINLGHYEEYRMVDVANRIKEKVGSQSEIIFEEPLLFMTPLGLPDITLAKQRLGWFPLVGLDEGLERTIEDIKANQHLLQPLLSKYEEEKE